MEISLTIPLLSSPKSSVVIWLRRRDRSLAAIRASVNGPSSVSSFLLSTGSYPGLTFFPFGNLTFFCLQLTKGVNFCHVFFRERTFPKKQTGAGWILVRKLGFGRRSSYMGGFGEASSPLSENGRLRLGRDEFADIVKIGTLSKCLFAVSYTQKEKKRKLNKK